MTDELPASQRFDEWRLVAIAFADVAGYTRHMARDSAEALARWQRLRGDLIAPLAARHGGRVVGAAGDSVLLEFDSVVRAVAWAMDVQDGVAAQRPGQDVASPMQLRIAVNADEVIYDDTTPQSDGVNVTSRLHQLAAPGEIVVTHLVREIVGARLPVAFRDLGTPQLKNIDRAIRAFIVDRSNRPAGEGTLPHLDWASRPAIAVLPFRVPAGCDDQRYFGDGIAEGIVDGLARSRSLLVIARSSTLRFGDADTDPRNAGHALGVRYIVTGAVRRLGDTLRISVELVDVALMHAVWSERFDGAIDDLFDFQDRIVASIVARVEPHVQQSEIARISGRPTESLDAHDSVLRALWHIYRFTQADHAVAAQLLDRAIRIDPGYARAHGHLAWLLNFWVGEGHSTDVPGDRAKAVAAAQTAIELDEGDAFCLSVRGHLMAFIEGRPEAGLDLLQRAVEVNPNSPLAWGLSANAHAYLGNGEQTRERLSNVWRLSPFDPLNFMFWTTAGIGEFVLGDLERAVDWCAMASRSKPRYLAPLRIMTAALGLMGRLDDAHATAEQIRTIDPRFRVSEFVAWYPFKQPADRERLAAGLRRAGLPE